MDQVGPIIAAELSRVRKQLKREQQKRREMQARRDRWRAETITLRRQISKTAQFSAAYRERQKAA